MFVNHQPNELRKEIPINTLFIIKSNQQDTYRATTVSNVLINFVIMDTAATVHTLLLQDATVAYHREMVRQMGQTHDHVMTPMMQLQDPEKTKGIIVTLAETTPVLEAANLQLDLRRMDMGC